MGLNDSLNKLERTFTTEKAKKQFEKRQKTEYKNYIYNKFILLFEKNILQDPLNTYSYFINPDIKNKYIKYKFLDLPEIEKNIIYNNILNQIYKDFKNNYKYNINYINEKEEKEKEQELIKNEKLKSKYLKSCENLEKQKKKHKKIKSKYFWGCLLGIKAGGVLAEKQAKKYKDTLF